MKNSALSTLLFVVLLFSVACDTTPPPPPVVFGVDRPFPLAIGQTGESKNELGFSIKFEKIASDSRCPKGVECITAGQADVVLTITKGGETSTVTLPFIIPNGTGNAIDLKGHTIRVMGVAPMKFKDKEIDPKEYNIMVLVTETVVGGAVAKLGQEFMLGIGESMGLDDDPGFRVRFDTVASDSRCPEGVQCIWAGKVDAVFTVTQGENAQKLTLSSGDMSQGGSGQAVAGKYNLALKAISPMKKKDVTIDSKGYKASVVIQKQDQ
ncbi:MAG: hypothetical protein JNN28_14455 [Saprospiraceae bacterium]|nr:hypothetical protein [Saprospiraceae bacterium]